MNTYSNNIVCTILTLQILYYFRCIRTIFTALSCKILNKDVFRNLNGLYIYQAVVLINIAACHKRKCRSTNG